MILDSSKDYCTGNIIIECSDDNTPHSEIISYVLDNFGIIPLSYVFNASNIGYGGYTNNAEYIVNGNISMFDDKFSPLDILDVVGFMRLL